MGKHDDLLRDVLAGLARPEKSIPPKYFYDEEGSRLFEAICATPEYYPTKVETALLERIAPELSARIAKDAALVEFGSGASEKTRLLLDAAPQVSTYVPFDISVAALAPAAARIAARYPRLSVLPVEGDFTRPLSTSAALGEGQRVGFFPGSTIGNFTQEEAKRFLAAARQFLGPRALFIVGVDLMKDIETLLAAYDDAAGVTAAFNLNLLTRINRELGADFDLGRFAHVAGWNPAEARIEMRLESLRDQVVRVAGRSFAFRAGEMLHTENSHKYTLDGFAGLAAAAGWTQRAAWTAPPPTFAVILLSAEGER